eukprot:TRINITY_DN7772_c0_g1_i1.p1 TRINITY_DN7772_c0_g1~~TRINITY_DN7772_c0_g1_i1.p1  ORF type:complete len:1961 (+),score=499.83 TRINITY_DN7772_c0_g1_i1:165-5885(+)
MEAVAVKQVVCGSCGWKGDPAEKCGGCGVKFGDFYCKECVIWDNEARHCEQCGYCVKRGLSHCAKCDRCIGQHICACDLPVGSKCHRCNTNLTDFSSDSITRSLCGNLLYHSQCLASVQSRYPSEMFIGSKPSFTGEKAKANMRVIVTEADISGFNLDFMPDPASKISMSLYCEAGKKVTNTADTKETGKWWIEKGRLCLQGVNKRNYTFKAADDYVAPHPSDLTMVDSATNGTAVLTVRPGLSIGMKVQRNPKYWQWDNQDGGPGNLGTVKTDRKKDTKGGSWISISWDKSGSSNSYRYGSEHAMDFLFADAEPTKIKEAAPVAKTLSQPENYVTSEDAAYSILGDVPFNAKSTAVPGGSLSLPKQWEPGTFTPKLLTHLEHGSCWKDFEVVDKNGDVYKNGKKVASSVSIVREGSRCKVLRKNCGVLLKCNRPLAWVLNGTDGRVIRIGDTVRVAESIKKPKYGWGTVKHFMAGIVTHVVSDVKCTVHFTSSGWSAASEEMEIQVLAGSSEPENAPSNFQEDLHQYELCSACCERNSRMSTECSHGRHLYQPIRSLDRKTNSVTVTTPIQCTIRELRVLNPEGALSPFRGRVVSTIGGVDASSTEAVKLLGEEGSVEVAFEAAEPPVECATCGVELCNEAGEVTPSAFGCSCADTYFCCWCTIIANRSLTTQGEGQQQAYRIADSPPCIAPGQIYWHEQHDRCVALRSTQYMAEIEVFGKPVPPRLSVMLPSPKKLAVPWNPVVKFPPGRYTAMSVPGAWVSKGVLQFDATIDVSSSSSDLFVGFTTPSVHLEQNHTQGVLPAQTCVFSCSKGYVYIDGRQTTLGLPHILPGSSVSCYIDFTHGVVYFRSGGRCTEAVPIRLALGGAEKVLPFALGRDCYVKDSVRTEEDPKTMWVMKGWLWHCAGPYHTGAVVAVKEQKKEGVMMATVVIPPVEGRLLVRTPQGCLEEICMRGGNICPVYNLAEGGQPEVVVTRTKRLVAPTESGWFYCGAPYANSVSNPGIENTAFCVPYGRREPCHQCRADLSESKTGLETYSFQEPVTFFVTATGKMCRGLYLRRETEGGGCALLDWEQGTCVRNVPEKNVFKTNFLYEVGDRVGEVDAVGCEEADHTSCHVVTDARFIDGEDLYRITPGWVKRKDLRPAFSATLVKNAEGVYSWLDHKTEVYYCGKDQCGLLKGKQCGGCKKFMETNEIPVSLGEPVAPDPAEEPEEKPEVKEVKQETAKESSTWACAACTFENSLEKDKCEMCETARPVKKAKKAKAAKVKLAAGMTVYVKVNKATATIVEKKTHGKYSGKFMIKYADGSTYHCTPGELKCVKEKPKDETAADAPPDPVCVKIITTGLRVKHDRPGWVVSVNPSDKTATVRVNTTTATYKESQLLVASPIPLLTNVVIMKASFHGTEGRLCRYNPKQETFLVSTKKGFLLCKRNEVVPRCRTMIKKTETTPDYVWNNENRPAWKDAGAYYCGAPECGVKHGDTQCAACASVSAQYYIGDTVYASASGTSVSRCVIIQPPGPKVKVAYISNGEEATLDLHQIRPTPASVTATVSDPFSAAIRNAGLLFRVAHDRYTVMPRSDSHRLPVPKTVNESTVWAAKEGGLWSFTWGAQKPKKQTVVQLGHRAIPYDLAAFIIGWTDPASSCALARCSSPWAAIHRKHFNVCVSDGKAIVDSNKQSRAMWDLHFTANEFNHISEENLRQMSETGERLWLCGSGADDDNLAVRNLLGGVTVPWEAGEVGSALEKIDHGSTEGTNEERAAMVKIIGETLKKQCQWYPPADPYRYIIAHLKSIDQKEEATYLNEARYDLMRKKSQTFRLLKSPDGAVEGFSGPMEWLPANSMLKPGMVVRKSKTSEEGVVVEVNSDSVKIESHSGQEDCSVKDLEVKVPRSTALQSTAQHVTLVQKAW